MPEEIFKGSFKETANDGHAAEQGIKRVLVVNKNSELMEELQNDEGTTDGDVSPKKTQRLNNATLENHKSETATLAISGELYLQSADTSVEEKSNICTKFSYPNVWPWDGSELAVASQTVVEPGVVAGDAIQKEQSGNDGSHTMAMPNKKTQAVNIPSCLKTNNTDKDGFLDFRKKSVQFQLGFDVVSQDNCCNGSDSSSTVKQGISDLARQSHENSAESGSELDLEKSEDFENIFGVEKIAGMEDGQSHKTQSTTSEVDSLLSQCAENAGAALENGDRNLSSSNGLSSLLAAYIPDSAEETSQTRTNEFHSSDTVLLSNGANPNIQSISSSLGLYPAEYSHNYEYSGMRSAGQYVGSSRQQFSHGYESSQQEFPNFTNPFILFSIPENVEVINYGVRPARHTSTRDEDIELTNTDRHAESENQVARDRRRYRSMLARGLCDLSLVMIVFMIMHFQERILPVIYDNLQCCCDGPPARFVFVANDLEFESFITDDPCRFVNEVENLVESRSIIEGLPMDGCIVDNSSLSEVDDAGAQYINDATQQKRQEDRPDSDDSESKDLSLGSETDSVPGGNSHDERSSENNEKFDDLSTIGSDNSDSSQLQDELDGGCFLHSAICCVASVVSGALGALGFWSWEKSQKRISLQQKQKAGADIVSDDCKTRAKSSKLQRVAEDPKMMLGSTDVGSAEGKLLQDGASSAFASEVAGEFHEKRETDGQTDSGQSDKKAAIDSQTIGAKKTKKHPKKKKPRKTEDMQGQQDASHLKSALGGDTENDISSRYAGTANNQASSKEKSGTAFASLQSRMQEQTDASRPYLTGESTDERDMFDDTVFESDEFLPVHSAWNSLTFEDNFENFSVSKSLVVDVSDGKAVIQPQQVLSSVSQTPYTNGLQNEQQSSQDPHAQSPHEADDSESSQIQAALTKHGLIQYENIMNKRYSKLSTEIDAWMSKVEKDDDRGYWIAEHIVGGAIKEGLMTIEKPNAGQSATKEENLSNHDKEIFGDKFDGVCEIQARLNLVALDLAVATDTHPQREILDVSRYNDAVRIEAALIKGKLINFTEVFEDMPRMRELRANVVAWDSEAKKDGAFRQLAQSIVWGAIEKGGIASKLKSAKHITQQEFELLQGRDYFVGIGEKCGAMNDEVEKKLIFVAQELMHKAENESHSDSAESTSRDDRHNQSFVTETSEKMNADFRSGKGEEVQDGKASKKNGTAICQVCGEKWGTVCDGGVVSETVCGCSRGTAAGIKPIVNEDPAKKRTLGDAPGGCGRKIIWSNPDIDKEREKITSWLMDSADPELKEMMKSLERIGEDVVFNEPKSISGDPIKQETSEYDWKAKEQLDLKEFKEKVHSLEKRHMESLTEFISDKSGISNPETQKQIFRLIQTHRQALETDVYEKFVDLHGAAQGEHIDYDASEELKQLTMKSRKEFRNFAKQYLNVNPDDFGRVQNAVRRCQYCGEIWVKVGGCHGITKCGMLPDFSDGGRKSDKCSSYGPAKRGCGKDIHWQDQATVSLDELIDNGVDIGEFKLALAAAEESYQEHATKIGNFLTARVR